MSAVGPVATALNARPDTLLHPPGPAFTTFPSRDKPHILETGF